MYYSSKAVTVNRSANREEQHGWTTSHRVQLQTGFNLNSPASGEPSGWGPCGFSGPYSQTQQEEMEACWADLGQSIMNDYAERRPFQRPWYWWVRRGLQQPEDERAKLQELGEL